MGRGGGEEVIEFRVGRRGGVVVCCPRRRWNEWMSGGEGAGVDESTTLRRGAAVECSATVVLERRAGHRSTSPCFMHCQQ